MSLTITCYIAIAVGVMIVVVVGWLFYMGLFNTMHVHVKEIESMTILNMNYSGSMQDTIKGFENYEKRAKALLPEMTLWSLMGGVYYTSPSEVANQDDNKWSVFFVLDEKPNMMKQALQLPASDEYTVITIPKSKVIHCTFPYRSALSYMFGPMKVYPAITKFMQKEKLSPVGCIELYHMTTEPIEYTMFLENKEIFDTLYKSKFTAVKSL